MSLTSSFLLYLAVFRIAVIGAGIVAIILGYKLFKRSPATSNTTEVSTKLGKFSLVLKNAAPGTCFAVFGAALICFNFRDGGPTLTLKTLGSFTPKTNAIPSRIEELTMKGSSSSLVDLTELGKQRERKKDLRGAKEAYTEALFLVAEPMNNLAYIYLEEKRTNDALSLAQTAVILVPDNANLLKTYVTALDANGNHTEANRLLQKAAQLGILEKTNRFRERTNR